MTTALPVKHPKILWAQDKKTVFITIECVDAKDEKIELTDNKLSFSVVQDATYSAELEFFAEINAQDSTQNKTDRHIYFNLVKKDQEQPFWPRLLKSAVKVPYIQTDFSRWRDEDEDEEQPAPGGFDPSMFANMGGMGGFDGGDDDPYGLDDKEVPVDDSSSDEAEEK